jgi:hypothetical protein
MLITDLFSLNTTIELICFITALICLKNDKSAVWKSLIVFTFLIFTVETIGLYLKHQRTSNQLIYNILLISYGVFMSLMFDQVIKPYIKNNVVLAVLLAVFILSFTYETLNKGLMVFHNNTYTILSVCYILCSLFYFALLLRDEGYVVLSRSASFWWVAGTLIFYFGSTAVNLFRGKLSIRVNEDHYLTFYIYVALDLLLYGCWSYSFICRKWLMTSSRSYS